MNSNSTILKALQEIRALDELRDKKLQAIITKLGSGQSNPSPSKKVNKGKEAAQRYMLKRITRMMAKQKQ